MPFADKDKERKQNEENTLIDFRVYGKQISLNTRRSPNSSRSSSRIEPAYRAMSATPSLYLEERHRKTPPWTRPQSADLTREGNHRRKIAAKFDRCSERRGSKNRKPSGSISNLLDTNSLDDSLDSETSVTPSPVPSLTDVLRPSNKLQPGLSAKPPIPPNGTISSNLIDSKKNHKSMDDIINIKFQRWFPESVQNNSGDIGTMENGISKGSMSELAGPSRRKMSSEPEIPLSKTPETQVNRLNSLTNYHFDAYEGSPIESSSKKISRSQTMETIIETEDSVPNTPEKNINRSNNVAFEQNKMENLEENRPLKTDTSVNKYLTNCSANEEGKTKKKKVTINDNARSESSSSGIATMIEECDSPSKVMSHLLSEPEEVGHEHTAAISKILEDEHASCILKYIGEEAQENKTIDQNSNSTKFVLPSNGENGGLNNADILSWIGSSNNNIPMEKTPSSTYNDIINMLKVLEKEEVDSVKLEALSAGRSGNNSVCSNVTPGRSSCRDILTYLDDVDRTDSRNELRTPQENKNSLEECEKPCEPHPGNNSTNTRPNSGRLAQLMSFDSAELARRVMALTLELEERETVLERTKERMGELQNKLSKNKTDTDAIVRRHQQFIDQLLSEKRLLGEQCASIVKEMENKHKKTLQTLEERHGIELKKLQEKMLAAEKIRREKWLDEKTKKIKEQTVRGLEPELERLTRAHQDELAEIRRAHERELAEMEASCSRRIATAREQALRDREQAVADEREAARNKLEHEMSELERSYQDQRRRLMAEVREEKERLTREAECSLAQRARQLEEKWQESHAQLQETLSEMQTKHQMEIKQMRETVEAERQSWLTHQTAALSEKERQIKEQCKKERDRHIEAVIKKLDQDAHEKQKHLETKLIRLKEQHESEMKEAEAGEAELRRKLKESRSENQQYEETVGKLKTQITNFEFQLATAKQQIDHLEREANERGNQARNEVSAQIASLQRELTEEKLKREEALSALQAEKERDLQQVYNRVKEAIAKKDETLRLVQKQRDAALEQCCQLENMLEQQRKEFAQRKHS